MDEAVAAACQAATSLDRLLPTDDKDALRPGANPPRALAQALERLCAACSTMRAVLDLVLDGMRPGGWLPSQN